MTDKSSKDIVRWKVDEVYTSPTEVIVRISAASYVLDGEWWPTPGQELIVAEEE